MSSRPHLFPFPSLLHSPQEQGNYSSISSSTHWHSLLGLCTEQVAPLRTLTPSFLRFPRLGAEEVYGLVTEHLPSTYEAMGLSPSHVKTSKQKT